MDGIWNHTDRGDLNLRSLSLDRTEQCCGVCLPTLNWRIGMLSIVSTEAPSTSLETMEAAPEEKGPQNGLR
jgi:hypothetical protein